MPAIKITGFDGLVPRTSPSLLGDSQAQLATNVKLYSRELRFWRGPSLQTADVIDDCGSIYKYYAADPDPYWLTWADEGVSVITSPITDTSDYRIYYTGDGVPKKSNETLVSTGSGPYPRAWRHMGVPAPTGAPTVANVGGAGSPEDRVYVYTYVSTFGSITEESAPSPASSIVTALAGGSITVNGFAAAPTTNYNITHLRIYRSVSGASTDSYQFVAQITVGAGTYSDSLTAAQLGETIGTIGWEPPPATLDGLVPLPSGALAGYSGNTVYFSEPFYPHAWPSAYSINIPSPIVGLGVFGSSIAVMTERYPYIIHGGIPGAMSVERVPTLEPCLSRRSIVSNEQGVLYASPNGLMQIGSTGIGIRTSALFRRDEWQAIQPALINAVSYDGKYFAMYPDTDDNLSSFILSEDDIPALSEIELKANAVHVDSQNAYLYFVNPLDNEIYQADADDLNPMTYTWKSRRFVLPQATSFSALKLDADFGQVELTEAYNDIVAELAAENVTLFGSDLMGALNAVAFNHFDVNGSTLQNLPNDASTRTAQVQLYGEGSLQATMTVDSYNPLRLPPFKSRDIEIQISGNISVRSVTIATTVPELHQ